jgi:DNA helicase-2/ATP-dependent DNA helicase PcrA
MSGVSSTNVRRTKCASVFDEHYRSLTTAQKRAVDAIEGPVMVVAAPGTGKTHVLALRTANILKRTHMRPTNILCLTFSVSGATAMRDRLRSIIGADAYGVTVSTIHGFCNELIQRYPNVFADVSALSPVSDIERVHIMNKLIDQLPTHAAIINPKDRSSRTMQILSRISEVKREGISFQKLEETIDVYRRIMETKSKPGTKVHERNLKTAEQFADFVSLFMLYEETLRERKLYDFDDMISWTKNALLEEEWLRASLQERYQYILVDEYQDTNGAQNDVLEVMTTMPDGVGTPNLFVVGDDDQAIYRFQGANVANMRRFLTRFPGALVVTLTDSFRSTEEILSAAATLIGHNTDRLSGSIDGVEKTMTSRLSEKHGTQPTLLRPPSAHVEAFAIRDIVDESIQCGFPPREIAVLTRTNAEAVQIADVLQRLDIPVQLSGSFDLLSHPKILELLALLKAIADPQSDHAMAGALSCVTCAAHPADIALLLHHVRDERQQGRGISLADCSLQLETHTQEWGIRSPDTLIAARDMILDLAQKKDSMTVPQLIEKLITQSGMIPHDTTAFDPLDLAALQELFHLIERRVHENRALNLRGILEEFHTRETFEIPLKFAAAHLTDDAVSVMTAHASKGLEFEVVILARFLEKHWDHKRGQPKLSFPEELIFGLREDENASLEDERRLSYVAMTRAKRRLIMVAPERIVKNDREQDASPSQFFSEAGMLPEERREIRDPQHAATILLPPPSIDLDEALRTFLRRRLETFELSPTSLNKFLESPEKFLREDLLLVPQAQNRATAYGTAVHRALQEWAMKYKEGFGLSEFLDAFSASLCERSILTDRERDDLLYVGRNALTRYYNERLAAGHPLIYGIEKNIEGTPRRYSAHGQNRPHRFVCARGNARACHRLQNRHAENGARRARRSWRRDVSTAGFLQTPDGTVAEFRRIRRDGMFP